MANYGKQEKTYKRGTEIVRKVAFSTSQAVTVETIDRPEVCFISRQKAESDMFTYAIALAQCSAILNTAHERCSVKSDKVKGLAGVQLAEAFDHLVKWQDEQL